MNKAEEMIVITRTYDLILWSCHHTGKFPRNHRFVLGKCLKVESYGFAAKAIDEIGRLVGGWLRSRPEATGG